NQNFDNVSANRIRAAGASFEGKSFGILCSAYLDDYTLNKLKENADEDAIEVLDKTPRAATQFLDPGGAVIGDTLQHEEGIAYATFDLEACIEPKQFHDIVGYYNRFDVFELSVARKRLEPIQFRDTTTVQNEVTQDSQQQERGLNDPME